MRDHDKIPLLVIACVYSSEKKAGYTVKFSQISRSHLE